MTIVALLLFAKTSGQPKIMLNVYDQVFLPLKFQTATPGKKGLHQRMWPLYFWEICERWQRLEGNFGIKIVINRINAFFQR
jgi:hypothetical protein